jgi:hypothetical protein
MIAELIPSQLADRFAVRPYEETDLLEDEPEWVVFNPFDVTYLRSATYAIGQLHRLRSGDRQISLHPDCSVEDLNALAWDASRRIAVGSRPATVTFVGFPGLDDREVFEVPEIQRFCQLLFELGFVSILEVTTSFASLLESYDPYTLGAFEIWLLANGLMEKTMETGEVRSLFAQFAELLPESNRRCDSWLPDGTAYSEERVSEARLVGVFGRDQANVVQWSGLNDE